MRFLEEHSARAHFQEKMWVIGSTRAHSFVKLLHCLKRYGHFESSRFGISKRKTDFNGRVFCFLTTFYNTYKLNFRSLEIEK